ncbi:hypothetical protein IKF84_00520 [Candidatus Saccharibacteria bacterium]|nr:hypothetical protein [Candidatus Saccharibacteria bacterium]
MLKYDEELNDVVFMLTKFSGDDLKYIAGTVYATVFIGKIPTKKDLAVYLGCSKGTITKVLEGLVATYVDPCTESAALVKWLSRYLPSTGDRPRISQLIYPIATELVSSGLYLGDGEEPFERAVSRLYLESLFRPQLVQSHKAFAGYNIMIDYLWRMTYIYGEKFDIYLLSRFESSHKAMAKVESFMEVIRKSNPQLRSYPATLDYVIDGFQEISVLIRDAGSAKIAKARLKKMLTEDHLF